MGYWKNNFYGGASPVAFANSRSVSITEQYKIDKEQNAAVLKWVPKVRRNLKTSAMQFTKGKTVSMVTRGTQTEGKLANSIRSKTGKDYGVIELVTFQFERHGVFVHKGVSSGHPISNPREATEWFNPILEKYIPELADRIADINADAALNATRMTIS